MSPVLRPRRVWVAEQKALAKKLSHAKAAKHQKDEQVSVCLSACALPRVQQYVECESACWQQCGGR
eukprot:279276-Rhodomonas_salina.1